MTLPVLGGLFLQIANLAGSAGKIWAQWDRRLFYVMTVMAALAAGFGIATAELRNLPLLAAITPVAPEARPFNKMVEATVNGKKIGSAEYYTALKLTAGRRTLISLLEQKALLQKAVRDHVTVSDGEVDGPSRRWRRKPRSRIEDANMRDLNAPAGAVSAAVEADDSPRGL